MQNNSFKELDVVKLTHDLNYDGTMYRNGTCGTIVHVYSDGTAYELEVAEPQGVITVYNDDLEKIFQSH